MDCIPLDFFVYGISQTRILESEVSQSCLILCDPMDCSLPGSFVHGIFQARVLEWVTISFSMVFSQPRDRIRVGLLHCRQTLYHLSSGLLFPSPGDLPDPEVKPMSPALTGGLFATEPPGKPI